MPQLWWLSLWFFTQIRWLNRYRRSLGSKKTTCTCMFPTQKLHFPNIYYGTFEPPPTRNTPNQLWLVKQRAFGGMGFFDLSQGFEYNKHSWLHRRKDEKEKASASVGFFIASIDFLIGQFFFQKIFVFWTHHTTPSHPQKASIMVGNFYPSQKSWTSSSRDIKI